MTSKLVIEFEKAVNKKQFHKSIICFTNRKFAKEAIYNRKKLESIDKSTLGFINDVFINENFPESCFLIYIYCSPSQNHDKFKDFCTKFYLLVSNIDNDFTLSWVILMIDARGGRKMILLTHLAKKMTLSYHQLNTHVINNSMP